MWHDEISWVILVCDRRIALIIQYRESTLRHQAGHLPKARPKHTAASAFVAASRVPCRMSHVSRGVVSYKTSRARWTVQTERSISQFDLEPSACVLVLIGTTLFLDGACASLLYSIICPPPGQNLCIFSRQEGRRSEKPGCQRALKRSLY